MYIYFYVYLIVSYFRILFLLKLSPFTMFFFICLSHILSLSLSVSLSFSLTLVSLLSLYSLSLYLPFPLNVFSYYSQYLFYY